MRQEPTPESSPPNTGEKKHSIFSSIHFKKHVSTNKINRLYTSHNNSSKTYIIRLIFSMEDKRELFKISPEFIYLRAISFLYI